MPEAHLQCNTCKHIFQSEYQSLVDKVKCPNCRETGSIFGEIETRRFHLLKRDDGYEVTIGMLEQVLEAYYSRSKHYQQQLLSFMEDRVGIHIRRFSDSFIFEQDDGMSLTIEEFLLLLVEDRATEKEVYSMWMGMFR